MRIFHLAQKSRGQEKKGLGHCSNLGEIKIRVTHEDGRMTDGWRGESAKGLVQFNSKSDWKHKRETPHADRVICTRAAFWGVHYSTQCLSMYADKTQDMRMCAPSSPQSRSSRGSAHLLSWAGPLC